MAENETIAAPITPPGQSAVAAVRVSGPDVPQILRLLSPKAEQILSSPRTAILSPIFDLAKDRVPGGEILTDRPIIDYGLFLYYRSPSSYTGEEVAEINIHGSPYLLRSLLSSLRAAGARTARPGEFTERAFHHGKLDLAQAEAIADLISAETESQAKVAREQLEGRLSGALSELGEPLRDLVAEIEARIDFPEEGIEPAALGAWLESLERVLQGAEHYVSTYSNGKIWRDGAAVALIGVPNSGKSSLLNRLVGEERAIVTPIPGTTRDSIEERITLGGMFIRLFDTAGLDTGERSLDPVEKLGIERSWSRARNADLVLLLFDAAKTAESGELLAGDRAVLNEIRSTVARVVPIATKVDLIAGQTSQIERARAAIRSAAGVEPLFVSSVSGEGIAALEQELSDQICRLAGGSGQVLICNQRHFEALTAAKNSLEQAKAGLINSLPAELVSLDLRSALSALNEIIGVTPNEDILGRIFEKFCIGK